jgi:threonine dehydratase
VITTADVEAAGERVGGRVRRTPLVEVEPDAFGPGVPLALKLELLQHTGSFKPRGIFNRILAVGEDAETVVAASGGNAGLAVAYAAARRRLWEQLRVVAEPGGACALAALTSGAWRPGRGERVAVIVCGGNTDPGDLG